MARCAGLILILLLAPALLPAQNADLSGRVVDRSQLPLVDAAVTVSAQDTGLKRSARTDSLGSYSVPDLAPGQYDIVVAAPGFTPQERHGVVLEIAQKAQLDFTLEVGPAAQTLTVAAGAGQPQTTDASVNTVLSRQLVASLPLNGRTFQNLITLAPGVNYSNARNSNGQFVANGMRASANSFTIDGVNAVGTVTGYQSAGGNNASYNLAGGTNGMAAVDAVEEFRIVTSSFAPEYGRNPGAHVLILTRSGTNQLHGTVFEYFRNDRLDAADWFVNQAAQPNPRLRANDFGGVLGGPVLRNKIFFFVSWESQRLAQPQFAIAAVPSLAARAAAPAAAQPFLNAFPLPNGPALSGGRAQFSAGYSNPLSTDSALMKSDQMLTGNLRSFATFTYAPSARTSRSNNGSASLADSNVQHLRVRSVTAGLTWIANASTVNDFRLNFADSVNQSHFTMDTFGGAVVPANDLLLPGTTPANYFSFVSLGDPGGDLFGGNSGTLNERQINLLDATTLVHGPHQIKFGVDYRLLLPFIAAAGDQYFQFDGVDGLVNNRLDAFHNTAPSRARTEIASLSLYVQDTWRAASSVNLTFGLRWDFNTVPRSLDPNNGNLVPLLGSYAPNNVTVGTPGTPLWKPRYANFAPRLGITWQVAKATVLRAGGGLFYDTGIAEASSQPWVTGYPAAPATVLLNSSLPVSPVEARLPALNLSQPPPGSLFFMFKPNLQAPRVWEWNAAIDQAIGSHQSLTVSYVGSLGRKLLYPVAYPEVTANLYAVTFTGDSGRSSYHSLQVQYERRLTRGVAASAGYAWSHSIDTNSSDTAISVPGVYQSPSSNRGDSDFDIRQTLHAGFSWNLPAGFGVDGILTSQAALPVNVTVNRNIGFGSYDFRPDLATNVPLWTANPDVAGGRQLNPVALPVPSGNVQGDLGRNSLRGFDLVQLDLSLRRSFRIGEKMRLLFRADLFNALNHPNFANPTPFIGAGFFGVSTSTIANSQVGGGQFGLNSVFNIGGPRAVQLSLRIEF